MLLFISAGQLYAAEQNSPEENGKRNWQPAFSVNEFNSPFARKLNYQERNDKKTEILYVSALGAGYALPFEYDIDDGERIALKRAEHDAFMRAVAAADYPLDSLISELGGENRKNLGKTFAWKYLNAWSGAFAQPVKKFSGSCEWIKNLGSRCVYFMEIKFAPLLKKDKKFKIKNLKISSKKYSPGNILSGSLTVTEDSWITVLLVSGNGEVKVLIPEEGSLDGYAKAGEKFDFECPAVFSEKDYGQGLVHIIAVKKAPLEIADKPIEDLIINDKYASENSYIEKISRNLWNVKRADWTAGIAVFEVSEK